jgi:hypothetical protein
MYHCIYHERQGAKAFASLSPILALRPVAVLVQEAHVPAARLPAVRRQLHKHFPAYRIFVNRNAQGQTVSGGFGGGRTHYGVTTDKRVKRIGCSVFKSLVEEQKLIITDADIISEISTFIERRNSFAADEGYFDDCVMTLVLFSWLSTQSYFKDLNDVNLRKVMYENQMKAIEDELTPFGFYNDGSSEDEQPLLNF